LRGPPLEVFGNDRRSGMQVRDRLEQRHDLDLEAGVIRERLGGGEIVGRARHRNDQTIEHVGSVALLKLGRPRQGFDQRLRRGTWTAAECVRRSSFAR